MDSTNYQDMCVPKDGEELIYIQQRLQSEILEHFTEYEKLNNLVDPTATLCDINDAAWISEEQSTLIDKLMEKEIPKTTMPETEPEQFLAVLDHFKKESAQQLESINAMDEQVKKLEAEAIQYNNILNTIRNSSGNLEEGNTDPKQIELNIKTKRDFNAYRLYLHQVLDQCFGKTNIKKLVEKLTNAYFKGGDDMYIDVSEVSIKEIEILDQASLISWHPSDKKIKFRDFK